MRTGYRKRFELRILPIDNPENFIVPSIQNVRLTDVCCTFLLSVSDSLAQYSRLKKAVPVILDTAMLLL